VVRLVDGGAELAAPLRLHLTEDAEAHRSRPVVVGAVRFLGAAVHRRRRSACPIRKAFFLSENRKSTTAT